MPDRMPDDGARLDAELVRAGTRALARARGRGIQAGLVTVDGVTAVKASTKVSVRMRCSRSKAAITT